MEGEELESFRAGLYGRAKKVTTETLPAFVDDMCEMPKTYDYAVYATAAAAVAASSAMNAHLGLTGFQAGCVMWEYMEAWNNVKFPSKLLRYESMLYPQYHKMFAKVISQETWTWLQQEARKGLDKWTAGNDMVSPKVVNHWLRIVSGEMPFGYMLDEEYDVCKNTRTPIRTQADVLKAWREGRLVEKV